MYLSCLLIDVGDNPDRPRPGRTWLRNIYHVHQRLCMAFPTDWRTNNDSPFLQPFSDADFPLLRKPNAKPGEPRHSFLFRIDNRIEDDVARAVILVQSEAKPNWDYAFGLKPGLLDPRTKRPIGNAGCLLAAPPQVRECSPAYTAGQELRFRVRVNLSKKPYPDKPGTDLRKPRNGTDKKGRPKDQGKRVSLTWDKGQKPDDVVREWFAKKAWITLTGVEGRDPVQAFTPRSCNLLQLGWVVGYKPPFGKGHQIKLRSALLEGTLTVADSAAFAQAIASGVGPGKAFGFGLLSVAPL